MMKSHNFSPSTQHPHVVNTGLTPSSGPLWKLFMKQADMPAWCMYSIFTAPNVARPVVPGAPAAPQSCSVAAGTAHTEAQRQQRTGRGSHFVSNVDLAEAESAEVRVGLLHRRLDGLAEQFLHEFADVGPHLFHCLRGLRETKDSVRIIVEENQK